MQVFPRFTSSLTRLSTGGEMEQPNQPVPQHNKIVRWICWAMTAIAAIVLAIMMFLSVADVILTQAFLRPIEGTFEIVGLLVIVVGCLGLGYTQRTKGNISIDIVPNRFSSRGKAILNIFSYSMSIVLCAIIVWQLSLRTYDYMFKTLGGKTITLQIMLWPFMLLMDICFAWVAVIYILDLINTFKEVFKR
jgi:TRAP-type C4-dicarboxylate transport system permease small subunit